jgi:hypothetical protein
MNGKCVYTKSKCIYDVCQGLSSNSCEENSLCQIDSFGNCGFDSCNEGSDQNDDGVMCLSLTGCGYEISDGICKVATSKFTEINVGRIQGNV